MNITSRADNEFDLAVIGGGINGSAIARDAAGRGLKTILLERDDLAAHTSSASSKLIHGGLRYLEMYDFALVRHALIEREVLLKAAPHIIWPLRFILPHHSELRPRWLIRTGLFLYDHLGGRERLPASQGIDLSIHAAGRSLKDEFTHGFEYSDCWVQDARLVVLNAMDAAERGCDVRVRCEVSELARRKDGWTLSLRDQLRQTNSTVTARMVVNAAGPWVSKVQDLDRHSKRHDKVRLVKGSHIVVPKLFDHAYAYIFQNADGRIIFALPYEHEFTLIGTTDVPVSDEPTPPEVDQDEIDYLCASASEYFSKPISPNDVVWRFSGVRPLHDDDAVQASKVTRDYKLALDDEGGAPIMSVFGGKITTCRHLAEDALSMINRQLGLKTSDWTEDASLPGGDMDDADFDAFHAALKKRLPGLPEAVLLDYARNYGTRIDSLLNGAKNEEDLGEHFGGPLYQREVEYLIAHEWAVNAVDILWRRSKKGLHVPEGTEARLDAWLQTHYRRDQGAPLARSS